MADEPIKLFSSRAERYPEPTAADATLTAGPAALAAIPVIGGSITEVLSYVLAPAVARRRDTWFKELADALEEAELKIDGFRIENLSKNEAFVSAVIEATRSAVSTHQDEKREALRNGLLHIAMHRSTDEDQQQTFLRFIDELTVWHLRFLALFQDPPRLIQQKGLQLNWVVGSTSRMLEEVYPDLQGKRALHDQLAIDLDARGLLDGSSFLHAMVSPNGMTANALRRLETIFYSSSQTRLGKRMADLTAQRNLFQNPRAPWEGAGTMNNPLIIYLLNCRLCGEHLSLTEEPGKDCYVDQEPCWIVTCEHRSQTMVYRKSEARIAESYWSAA